MKKLLIFACAAAALATAAQAASFVELTGNISVDTRWTRDNVYILREIVNVLPPAKLTIEAGTIIRGVREGSGQDTPAAASPGTLNVARGAQIFAQGTADDPIVFTSINDPNVIGGTDTIPASVNGINTNTLPAQIYTADGATGANGFAHDQLCGGLIVLGEAPIGFDGDGDGLKLQYDPVLNTYSGDTISFPVGASPLAGTHDIKGGDGVGIALIEGLSLSATAATYTDPFPGAPNAPAAGNIYPGVYGGLDRADNSGVLQFVEHRYGGNIIGLNNEVNGQTFGATGTACTFEWLSSFNNADDGFEFFGGYANFKWLFSLYQGDDGLDGDQGFNGTIQHAFVLVDDQSEVRAASFGGTLTGRIVGNIGDNGAEWDGSEEVDQGSITPNTNPYVYNFTLCPSPAAGKDGLRLRRGTLGLWTNGLVQDGPDDAFAVQTAASGGNMAPGAVVRDFLVYATVADAATELGTVKYSDAPATVPPALARELNSLPRATWPAGFGENSLNPTLAAGAAAATPANFNVPAARVDIYPYSDWVPSPIGAAMRDNNALAWTALERIKNAAGNDMVVNNSSRPAVTIGKSGANPTVSFPAASGVGGRAAIYIVECSVGFGKYKPVAAVADNTAPAALPTFSGATFLSTDTNASAGSITVTDSSITLSPGVVIRYRVYSL